MKLLDKFKRKNVIEFSCPEELVDSIPHPVPAAKLMPEWYKKLPRKPRPDASSTDTGTVKTCIPVLDSVTEGYIIPLWCDVKFIIYNTFTLKDKKDRVICEAYSFGENPENLREGQEAPDKDGKKHIIKSVEKTGYTVKVEFPQGFGGGKYNSMGGHSWDQVGEACDLKKFTLGKILMKWHNPWIITTPKGWSTRYKNPTNNWSTDIHLIEAIVDTDKYYNEVNLPFVWTGDQAGEFIIKAGTPLLHVIPYKRQKTEMIVTETDVTKAIHVHNRMGEKFTDRYKNFFWNKGSNQYDVHSRK